MHHGDQLEIVAKPLIRWRHVGLDDKIIKVSRFGTELTAKLIEGSKLRIRAWSPGDIFLFNM